MIELSNINKSYGPHQVLCDVDLSIQTGEIFGVIGRSGAGKSTLLRCMNLLETPDVGRVMIDGREMMGLPRSELRAARHHIAMIFQQFNLLSSKTVYDNIALPMRIQGMNEQQIEQRIHELLPVVGLNDKARAYPAQLSGGQKQRVAIARALSCSPSLLLCDEATSALDPETTESILTLLQKINRLYGITIVLITHEMDVIKRICHRLAVMERGRIMEVLPIAQVFREKQSIARGLLYSQLSPELPLCLKQRLSQEPNHRPLLRLFFENESASTPFISQTSRTLALDINILLANIDTFNDHICGVLVVELMANAEQLQAFLVCCQEAQLTVEVLGYVATHAA